MKNTTVWGAFYDVLRAYNMTTIFGNPGSTEQPLLMNFPSDFNYILGLQEASVVGMADGFIQATRSPALAVLHTAAGTGNAMGNIMTAFLNKTPLIVLAGQQTRQMLLGDPYLTNRDATILPQPWVKWSYQPVRAEDVPAALVRAIAIATMPPAGPVFLSIPLGDWAAEVDEVPALRTASTRIAPGPDQLTDFSDRILQSQRLALVLGPEVDRSLGWGAAVQLAELLNASVFQSPLSERAVFPEDHPLFRGALPIARGPLSDALADFDLVLVIGAEIWRYYPWAPGSVLPPGLDLLQITNVEDLLEAWPIIQQETYFTSASGGLGWGGPDAVGIALAQHNRTTVLVIGDGSLHYSVQSIYTAVQQRLNLIILVPRNEEYAILKEFAVFEDTPNCPALNLPGLDAKGMAEAYGCTAFRADTPAALHDAFQQARRLGGPALIEFQIDPKLEALPV